MLMKRVLVLLLFVSLTPVWAISYTVQLFASSDEARASQLQQQLAGQGFKAYLLSVPTAQGQVYRIRVGAFANRAAAALFAQVLQGVEGSTPSPALAEGGVQPGLIPLEPALLGQYDLASTLVQVYPWPLIEPAAAQTPQPTETDEPPQVTVAPQTEFSSEPLGQTAANQPAIVIRTQPLDASEQARYRVGDLEFDAWQAAPQEDGSILRVRSFPVWPEDWQSASDLQREQYRETVLANLSGDLDLTPQQLEPFVFEQEDKAPFVVLVERFYPETQQIERLRSIGQPRPNEANLGLTLWGPATFFGEVVDIPVPENIVEPDETTRAPDSVSGDGWQASSEDEFVMLTFENQTWRAAVGQSLWANGDLLVSFYEGQILVYKIQQP
jgi:cell division septation protein DedD